VKKLNQDEIKNIVENKINQLIGELKNFPEKFLTEEDIRSYLYHILMKNFSKLKIV
jgi:hypothetical protein